MIMNKIGVTLQTILQGLLVVGFTKQNFNVQKPETNEFLRLDFYEKFEDTMKYLKYEANKCEFG